LDLLHDEEWEAKLSAKAPRILLAHGPRAEGQHELAWERLAPGHYQASMELPDGEMVRGAVQVGSQALTFGPALVGTSAEWAFDEARAEELRAVSKASGGRELLELSQAWRSPQVARFTELNSYLLVGALLLILLEAFVTRTGWKMPEWAFAGWRLKKPASQADAASMAHQERLKKPVLPGTAAAPAPVRPESTSLPPGAAATEDRQRRFDRAKRRGGS
jgi:hypothetical protein